jgi:hypothetical protein
MQRIGVRFTYERVECRPKLEDEGICRGTEPLVKSAALSLKSVAQILVKPVNVQKDQASQNQEKNTHDRHIRLGMPPQLLERDRAWNWDS